MNFENNDELKDVLNKYGRDITKNVLDNKVDPVIGRDEEIRNVVRILSRKSKNNPVLIGEPGVGKTAIVEGLAQRIIKGDIPSSLKNKTIWELDLGALVSFRVKSPRPLPKRPWPTQRTTGTTSSSSTRRAACMWTGT